MSTLVEMTENLNMSFRIGKPAESDRTIFNQTHCPCGPGYQEMADELKVESRLR
jgi:hypothetical protein